MLFVEAVPVLLGLVALAYKDWFGVPPGTSELASCVPTIEGPLQSITITKVTRYEQRVSAPLPTITVTTTVGYITPASVVHTTIATPYAMVRPRPKQLQPIWSPRPEPFDAFASLVLTRAHSFASWLTEPKFSILQILFTFSALVMHGWGLFLILYLFARQTLSWSFFNRYFSRTYLESWVPLIVKAPCVWYDGRMLDWRAGRVMEVPTERRLFAAKVYPEAYGREPLPPFPLGAVTVCVRAWKMVYETLVFIKQTPLRVYLTVGDFALQVPYSLCTFLRLYFLGCIERIPRRVEDLVDMLLKADEFSHQYVQEKVQWMFDMLRLCLGWISLAVRALAHQRNLKKEKTQIMVTGEYFLARDDYDIALTSTYEDVLLLQRDNRANERYLKDLTAEFARYKTDNPAGVSDELARRIYKRGGWQLVKDIQGMDPRGGGFRQPSLPTDAATDAADTATFLSLFRAGQISPYDNKYLPIDADLSPLTGKQPQYRYGNGLFGYVVPDNGRPKELYKIPYSSPTFSIPVPATPVTSGLWDLPTGNSSPTAGLSDPSTPQQQEGDAASSPGSSRSMVPYFS